MNESLDRQEGLDDLAGLLDLTQEGSPDPGERFDKKVLREWTLYRHARTLKFWTPALVGAGIASLAILAAMEMVYSMPSRRPAMTQGQEARVLPQPTVPSFTDPGVIPDQVR